MDDTLAHAAHRSVGESVSRRRCISAAAVATLGALAAYNAPSAIGDAAAPSVVRAIRPRPPHRVWFQPRLFARDIDLYSNMTIDASGWIDPRLMHAAGKTTLDWVYGLEHPSAGGPGYWRDACSAAARSRPARDPRFISAGVAIDEWTPPVAANNPRWLAEGLRAAKRADPKLFIAVWITDPTDPLFDLARDGTIDLVIVEGYTHSAANLGPGLTTSFDGGLRRCEAMAKAGLIQKTIFGFGHITAQANRDGKFLSADWLRARMVELKHRYPTMPGVGFFESTDPDSTELRKLVRAADHFSGELWP